MAQTTQEPLGKAEQMLVDMIDGQPIVESPDDKIQGLLMELAQVIAEGGGGGGGGGTTNYNMLTNKPKINSVELSGAKTGAMLGLQDTLEWDDAPTENSQKSVKSGGIYSALANKVDKQAGKGLSSNDFTNAHIVKLTGIESGAQVNVIETITVNGVEMIPSNKTVALTVLTKAVNDLENYYLKSQTYTKTEVQELIGQISALSVEIVDELPEQDISTTTIYLVETEVQNVYMQYMYINDEWAALGSTSVDLSNYYTKAQVDALLNNKQDKLEWDSVPTAGSTKDINSGAVANALNGKQDALEWDDAPTEDSTKSVNSGVMYDALADKQDKLEWDSVPTAGSTKSLTSGAIKTALDNATPPIATDSSAGIVQPDGTTVFVDENGVISAAAGVDFDERDFVEDSGTVALVDSQRIFTGTQAEWDALSTAVKKTYGQANITDDESGGTPDYYSTSEVKTNKVWIDGKPIYRRVIALTNKTVGDGTEIATLTDYATLDYVTYKYDAKISGASWTTGFYSRVEEGGSAILKMIYNPSTGKFFGVSSSRTFAEIYITIEYTKTTD